MATKTELVPPRSLIRAIAEGNCVAFVGAGFSGAGGIPTWQRLLHGIAESELRRGGALRQFIEARLGPDATPAAHVLDQAAQLLDDALGARFREALGGRVRGAWSDAMRERVRLLRGIPFRAILTTNYDGFLEPRPARGARHAVLRAPTRSWLGRLLEDVDGRWTTPVIKLHGGVEDAVITRQDYRRQLYASPGYMTFLRSVLASRTVLYLGFSFTDAYLNELRSEVLSMLGEGAAERLKTPTAFALVSDVAPPQRRIFRAHEGVRVLSYDSARGHSAFDEFLVRLHDETNPVRRFARRLATRRLLWVDPRPANNSHERRILAAVCDRQQEAPPEVVEERDHARAALLLGRGGFDLAISSWGSPSPQYDGLAPGEWLARRLRRRGADVPLLFFTSRQDPTRRATATRLGAAAYCTRWDELFPAIERVLGDLA